MDEMVLDVMISLQELLLLDYEEDLRIYVDKYNLFKRKYNNLNDEEKESIRDILLPINTHNLVLN